MITELTKEQEALLPVYREKWIKIGLSTERIDKKYAEKVCKELYEHVLQKPVVPVVCFDSPLQAWKAIKKRYGATEFVWPYIDGQFFASFLSYADYIDTELELELPKEYHIFKQIQNLGLVFPFDDMCFVTDRMSKVSMNDEGVIHCDNGPAVEYPDGFAVYVLNGVRVTKEIVMTPSEELDPALILKERNAEIRREILRKIGADRVVEKLEATTIHSDNKGIYDLIEVQLGEDVKGRYLKMKNPSIGTWHVEGVPRECETIEMALAWRNYEWEIGKPFDGYTIPQSLT